MASAAEFAKLWAVPVLLGMLLGAIANVGYAVISLQQSVASCAATSTSPESSFQLVGAEQGLGPKPLEEVTFEGGVKLQEIINGDPAVLALSINNYQLQQLIEQASSLATNQRKRLNTLIQLAQQELDAASVASGEVRVVAESALPALVAAAQAETPEKRVEAAAQVPFTTENLDALVRAAGAPGAGWTPQEAPWKCMQLLCQARRLQEDFSTKRQRAEQLRRQQVLALARKEKEVEVRDTLGVTGTIRATLSEQARTLTDDDAAIKSFMYKKFLGPYLTYDNRAEVLEREEGEAGAQAQAAEAERDTAQRAWEDADAALNASCGVRLPLADWEEAHNRVLRHHRAVTDEAKDRWCIDWISGDPSHRTAPGLMLPRAMWERDLRPRNATLSLLVLAEKDAGPPPKEDIQRLVQWALQCALGDQAATGKPKVSVDMLFAVSGGVAAASAVDSWVSEQLEAVQSADKNTERALMGFESVSLPRPPTFSTFQTLDMLSRIAQGATLLALHSQQGPAPSCAGLDLALGTLEAHPKVALVGFRAEPVEHGLAKAEEALKNSKAFKPIAGPKGSPPGLGFSFANYVSGLPLVVRSSALRTIGGIDDTPLLGPDGQIIDAWMLSTRLWLAGFQVALAPEAEAPAPPVGKKTVPVEGAVYPETLAVSVPPQAKLKALLQLYDQVEKALASAS